MDMSFANKAFSAKYMARNHSKLETNYPDPKNIDKEIARLKLVSMGVEIDTMTAEQAKYLSSWEWERRHAYMLKELVSLVFKDKFGIVNSMMFESVQKIIYDIHRGQNCRITGEK
jgi:hypothetical protein